MLITRTETHRGVHCTSRLETNILTLQLSALVTVDVKPIGTLYILICFYHQNNAKFSEDSENKYNKYFT